MSDWILPIFPEGSLASSVITTVWVGVWVVALFNLRFGWVLSGLVVPGYLVPLMIVKPFAAAVIIMEAAITYGLVWLFSERLSSGQSWSSLFGRDRFMALVLVSIGVRLVSDTLVLPAFGVWANAQFGIAFDWRNNLHSFGLIVISLLANQFWKPGLIRGLIPALITLGLTFALVRYGLMEFTNFRISGIAYLYEGYAASILASPKAYIVLVATAFVASRMNLRYGWEFGGILIPALIALQWYQPVKVLTSFVEAFVIYGIGALILRTSLFANVTMEGARKLLLFFNISFVWRLAVGWLVPLAGIEMKSSDLFGFGYLLTTLMAIKMFDKGILTRFTRSTLQISLVGAAAGTAVGFALLFNPVDLVVFPAEPRAEEVAPLHRPVGDLAQILARESIPVYGRISSEPHPEPDAAALAAFRRGVAMLIDSEGVLDPDRWAKAAGFLAVAGYQLNLVQERWLVLTEKTPGRGWGCFVINPLATAPLLLVVPDPLVIPGLSAAAARLTQDQGALAVAIAGRSAAVAGDRDLDPVKRRQPILSSFVEMTGRVGVVQMSPGAPLLAVSGMLPRGLDAIGLGRSLATELPAEFGAAPEGNLLAAGAGAGFAELRLDRPAVRRLLAKGIEIEVTTDGPSLSGDLLEKFSQPGVLAPAGSNAYIAPDLAQLRYLDALLSGQSPNKFNWL